MKTTASRLSGVLCAASAAVCVQTLAGQEAPGYDPLPDTRQATSVATGRSTLALAWATSRDVGSHLYRQRAGIRPGTHAGEQVVSISPPSAKGGAKVAAIAVPQPNRWEVFGSLYYQSQDHDGERVPNRGKKKKDEDKKWDKYDKYGGFEVGYGSVPGFSTATADSSLEIFGGSVGVEYRLTRHWSVGVGFSAARGDLDIDTIGGADIDSVGVTPYLSYYMPDAVGSADVWAGLMYGWGRHSYETQRDTGGGLATGSPDATTHTVEFQTGLNFGEEALVHGPYGGVRYVSGSIDAYSERGPGATDFGGQDVDSLVSILGYQVSWRMRGGSGYWVPQLRAAWEHEFEDGNTSAFGIPYLANDEDTGVLGAGLGYWWDTGWRVGLEYEGRFGSDSEAHYGGVSAGKEF